MTIEDKQLVMHLGMPKTGTTAIQHYLERNAQVYSDIGIDIPADTSGHPRTPGGGVVGAPQLDSARFFFDGYHVPETITRMDWGDKIRRLAEDDSRRKLIVSCEGFGPAHDRLRHSVFATLPDNVKPVFILYLRQPIDFLNSLVLQLIMGSPLRGAQFETMLKGHIDNYATVGYRGLIETFARHGEVIVRSYEQARSDLIADFCTSIDIPLMTEPAREKATNVKSYGRDAGLLFWALRAQQPNDMPMRGFIRMRNALARKVEDVDASPKSFIAEPEFSQIMAQWAQERTWLEETYGGTFKAETNHVPQSSALKMSAQFANEVAPHAAARLSATDYDWFRQAVHLATSGLSLSDSAAHMKSIAKDSPNAVTLPEQETIMADTPETVELDQQIVVRVAASIWMAHKRVAEPDISTEALVTGWKEEENKPYQEARIVLRQMMARGLTVTLENADEG
ncbi:MAG: hypothetical protein AAGM84_03240 [Pseudomonadota bacterium]